MKFCRGCEREKENAEFSPCKNTKDQLKTYCKECHNAMERMRFHDPNNPRFTKEGIEKEYKKKFTFRRTPKGRYGTYKGGAKRRNIPFKLTRDEFMDFWQKPCSYCGNPIETIGIDRVDNTKGYSIDNCVPCCWDCNEMRHARTLTDWLGHIKRIYKYQEFDK